ncbi:Holliday junction branch migration protein RuvA [Rapidithrix thailandica]|uniref:Holliday junction branch migration complex subunit RuvA n=1 Tax=Rapidithrix thailandica TaxID=413964 RepID=A0AAW9SDD4_9BACT
MYNYISGKLVEKEPTFAVIDVNGIGYELKIPLSTYSQLGKQEYCKLYTYIHIKEDAHTLFGFINKDEKALFLLLISVSGVGPSIGLTLLSSLSTDEIRSAILRGDAKLLQSVKGLGAKTAQRVILELKDKLKKSGHEDIIQGEAFASDTHNREEALNALLALGINKGMAEKGLNTVIKTHGDQLSVEELVKFALRNR